MFKALTAGRGGGGLKGLKGGLASEYADAGEKTASLSCWIELSFEGMSLIQGVSSFSSCIEVSRPE